MLWAYGNSRGDLRLLNAADHGVDAGKLGPLGRLRRFPRLAQVMAEAPSHRRPPGPAPPGLRQPYRLGTALRTHARSPRRCATRGSGRPEGLPRSTPSPLVVHQARRPGVKRPPEGQPSTVSVSVVVAVSFGRLLAVSHLDLDRVRPGVTVAAPCPRALPSSSGSGQSARFPCAFHLYGVTPPLAVSWTLYGVPTVGVRQGRRGHLERSDRQREVLHRLITDAVIGQEGNLGRPGLLRRTRDGSVRVGQALWQVCPLRSGSAPDSPWSSP